MGDENESGRTRPAPSLPWQRLWKDDTLLGKLLRGSPIGGIHRFVETGKDYLFDGIVFAHFRGRFAYRDLNSEVDWKSVDAATDGGEGKS